MLLIQKYFPNLTEIQFKQFEALQGLYEEWNSQINVISRKDIEALYLRHVLHSLALAKLIEFKAGAQILDVGTGGGFPGIPLAILFPEVKFHLVDSINKKLKVVNGVAESLGLENIKTTHARAESIKGHYDFIISRAVTNMPDFVGWVKNKIAKKSVHPIKNGILYLKGGDLTEELKIYTKATLYDLSAYFEEDFFETKKIVHLPLKYKG
ncbi:MAG: 16S rRNA (guanine(527)-N(7))-methyltransferase RsmG [Flavobacteriaceae bacterium]|jgi:16S rRNA (guanine527-N7)-methyltransferase|nr:16S rRNA (guanine(527)-N(7))-methyltransferase RsmG [Flavobacteriaceae bacterium]MDA7727799.1 16S rRNA (guanine(527)-N(7))-methyltransferase RsmG [Flavobacteriaceae bacterium]MDB4178487.1 16S rRNA (guanine(527)-N(7))-methyltransferase RsmG [Flavobacteriaceae bacterium]MDG1309063.1 16S rRNA (guanine(527)-N(7))-methyltransferase RsmG [Flavobacteriaceae bacterium]|tara:strand:- start:10561 stop:11190 length:630 start_codon:yes stop_codon:yes gene_type:complete